MSNTMEEYQRAIQANQASNYQSYSNPMQDKESAIIRLTDTELELNNFEDYLRNRKKLSNGQYHSYGEPLMTEQGIFEVMTHIDPIINKHTIMGDFDRKDVSNILLMLADSMASNMMLNRKSYGIDERTRKTIFHKSVLLSNQILHRGLEGGDRRFWKGSTTEIKTSIDNPGSKKGFLSSVNPFGK